MLSRIENLRENEGYILEALTHILVMVREKMLLPYHVEKWNLMIDTNDVGVMKNLTEFMNKMFNEVVRNHFPMTINKVYFMNVSNLLMNFAEEWNRKYFLQLQENELIL